MPTVPTINVPQVRTAPIADGSARVSFTPDTFGAPVAQGLGNVASVVHEAHLDALHQARKIQLNTFALERQKVKAGLLYDPQSGAMNTRGSKAFGISQKTLSEYDKRVGEITAKIPDHQVRQAFDEESAHDRMEIMGRLDQHEGQQYQEHDRDTFLATQDALRVQAARDAGNLHAVGDAVSRMEFDISEYGNRNGMPKEAIANMQAQVRSQTHAQAILSLSSADNYTAANQRFADVSSSLLPDDKEKLEKALEVGTLRGESMRLADEIMKEKPNATIEELFQAAALKTNEPKLREELEQRVAKLHGAHEQAQHEAQGNAFDAAYQVMQTDPRGFDAIAPEEVMKMSPQQVEALRSFERKGGVITTDRDTYHYLIQLSSTPAGRAVMMGRGKDPKTGEMFDLRAYRANLSDADWQEMSKLVGNVRDKATAPETAKQLGQIEDFEGVARQSLAPLGLNSTVGPKNKDNATVIAFKDALRRRVAGLQAATGKQLTRDQVQKEADALVIQEQVTRRHPNPYFVAPEGADLPWYKAIKRWGAPLGVSTTDKYMGAPYQESRYLFQNPAIAGTAITLDQVPLDEEIEVDGRTRRIGDLLAEALNSQGEGGRFNYDSDPAAYDREIVRRYNLWLGQTNDGK